MQIPVPYEQASLRKSPEPVAIAIAKDRRGRHNPITLTWAMSTSKEPPMVAIAIGLARHSLEAVRTARQFVLSLPSADQASEALLFGTRSGRELDKLAACGTPTQPATRIDGVLLTDAVANFECELVSELPVGDHVIFVGRVVAAHVNSDPGVRRLYARGEPLGMGGVVAG